MSCLPAVARQRQVPYLCSPSDRDPDDEREHSGRIDGNRGVLKRHCDRGQGTGKGEGDGDDDSRVESRLCFNFEGEFHAQKFWKKGKLREKSQSVLVKCACVRGMNWGQCNRQSYGSCITMDLRCGRKLVVMK